jgi:hypothetical protein
MAAKKRAEKKRTTKKRTTLRSTAGKKLYAKRARTGEFEDVQSYKRAHGSDVKRVSKAETAARKKRLLRSARRRVRP